jgi:hypothetical protein
MDAAVPNTILEWLIFFIISPQVKINAIKRLHPQTSIYPYFIKP